MCTKELQRLLNDNFAKLREGVRAQLLWLTRELIALDAHDAEGLCLNLLRQVCVCVNDRSIASVSLYHNPRQTWSPRGLSESARTSQNALPES